MTWINILQLKRPQPLHTINAIKQLSSQAEVVLQMLFSVGCLPGKTGQTTHMSKDGSETDLFSTSYSVQLWKTLGPRGYLKTLLGAKAASLHLIDMLEQQVQDTLSADGIFQLDETIADFQQGYACLTYSS